MNPTEQFYHDLDAITHKGIRPGLENIKKALDLVGNPQDKLKIIHIAGTNGKGSTCQFLSQILDTKNQTAGLFLSPHVEFYSERIQTVDAKGVQQIPENHLVDLHHELKGLVWDKVSLTYFEWSVFLALNYFEKLNVDYVVLETGLGGRWDATNICKSVLSCIVSVGLDHMDILGDTVEKILNEKLQIIKKDSHFVFAPQDLSLQEVAQKHCESVGATYHHQNELLSRATQIYDRQNVPFAGYLKHNFKLALCLAILLKDLSLGDFNEENLSQVVPPPGRFEILRKSPLVVMDGAHNEPALKSLKSLLNEKGIHKYHLVFGCLKNRPALELAELIQSPQGNNYWMEFDGGPFTTPRQTYETLQQKWGGQILDLNAESLKNLFKSKETIVICGSFYLCGAIKQILKEGVL